MDYMSPLVSLIPPEEDGGKLLQDWADAIEKARDFDTEVDEELFLQGMRAAGRLSAIFEDYNMEMIAASTPSTSSPTTSIRSQIRSAPTVG